MRVARTGTGCAQAAFGVEKEYTRNDDRFAWAKAFPDFHAIGEPHAKRHLARFEAFYYGNEHVLLPCGVHHRVPRHGDDGLSGGLERGSAKQAGSERAAGIES